MINPDVIGRIAEQQIQEAIEEGKFDNLPGKGQPLSLEEDQVTPPHLRMANQVLKNAGVLPDWMQVQQEIESERREAARQRERLIRENESRRARTADLSADHRIAQQYAIWHARNREAYLRRLKNVNTSILKLCMTAPSTVQPQIPYRMDAETAAFDADFPGPETPLPADALPPPERPSLIKSLFRATYTQGRADDPPSKF